MIEALQILSEEIPRIGSNISALVVIATVFAIAYKISSIFENRVFRYLIVVLATITLLNPIDPKYHSVFFNIQNWVALGALIPHIKFILEDIEEKYYQLKYATINAYYFWLTVYYKLLRFFRSAVWFVVTLFNALVWLYYTAKHTILLIVYFAYSINKTTEHPFRRRFQIYRQWYKEDWQYQSEQRKYAKYEYREWYKGTKFYYKNSDNYFNDSWFESKQRQNKQEEQRKAHEESRRAYEESKSYQKSYQNQSEQKQYSSKHARFFSGNYYEVLGVAKNASFDEIKTAWKKLVKEYHPDLHPENQDEFTKIIQKINEAYEYFKKMNS